MRYVRGRPACVGEARAFGGDRRGAVSVIFCVAATVLFGLVGGAINYARLLARRNQLQAAVYAGALAGGNTRKRP